MVSNVSPTSQSQQSIHVKKLSPRPSSEPSFSGSSKASDTFKSQKAAPKFGGNGEEGGLKKALRKVTAGTVGALSAGGLAIGVPLGLMQMALGIFIHPLLITGALTMGIPLAGAIGSYFLWKDK